MGTLNIEKFLPRCTLSNMIQRDPLASISYLCSQDGLKSLRQLDLANWTQTTLVPELPMARTYPNSIGKIAWSSNKKSVFFVDCNNALSQVDLNSGTVVNFRLDAPVTEIHTLSNRSALAVTFDNQKIALIEPGDNNPKTEIIFGSAGNLDLFVGDLSVVDDLVATRMWSDSTMPWYFSELLVLDVFGSIVWKYSNPNHMISQPRFSPDGQRLAFVSSHEGNLGIYIVDRSWGKPQLVSDSIYDYSNIDLGFGQKSYCWTSTSTNLCANRSENGFGRFLYLDVTQNQAPIEIAKGFVDSPICIQDHVIGVRSGARTPAELVAYDLTSISPNPRKQKTRKLVIESLHESALLGVPLGEPEINTSPSAIDEFATTGQNATVISRIFKEQHPFVKGTIVMLHGGPVDQTQVRFVPRIAYLAALGYRVVNIDPRGTTGYGIGYINSLSGKWGQADLADVENVINDLLKRSRIQSPIFAMGGSAGGFLALKLAASSNVSIQGVIASYPVVDADELAKNTHRFEKSYTNILLGKNVLENSTHQTKSPIDEISNISCPILLFHGDSDEVVPIDATKTYVERLKIANKDVQFVVYQGEGHGWGNKDTLQDELTKITDFIDGITKTLDH